MNVLMEKYNNLSEKDQRALKLLTAVVAPLLLYFLIFNPSIGYYLSAKQHYAESQDLLVWINKNEHRVVSISQIANSLSDKPLLQVISTAAETNNIKITRLQPEGNGQVRIWLNNAEFATTTSWLSELTRQAGLTIAFISIDKTNSPGIVNIQCLLTAPPN